MGQDPNQPYPGQYGQPSQPPEGNYQGGYSQQGAYPPPNPGYPPPNPGYQPPNTGYQQPGPGGYQQQGYQYQQPYGQAGPMYNTAHPNGATSMNMDPNTSAGLSYLVGWITGLIFFLGEKQNRFVRFHAMQSILLSVALIVLEVVLGFILALPYIGLIGCVLWPLVGLGIFAVWIYCLINAFQGKYFKLPIIGDYAERYANSGTPGMR